jgi:uncharacterized protein YecA (UPF0149 family)
MVAKRITLEVAAFLDSAQAKDLTGVLPAQLHQIIETFLSVCYEDLGTEPRRLDGHDLHQALAHLLPGRMARKDPLAEHVPAVLEAYFQHLQEVAVVANAFELKMSLEATAPEFLETVRTGHNAHHGHHQKQKPVVHKAEKLGRNDPCSCGSGKKFKKCHGKGA